VDRARGGDRDAFEELVRETSGGLYAVAYRLCGNEQDARDVVQDAYLRAFRSIRSFRGDAAFSTWLYRIATNCASTFHRRRQGAETAPIEAALEQAGRPGDLELDAIGTATVERHRLVRALEGLPQTLRAVVVLHDVYDLSHDRVAAELEISGAAARVRLHRARRLLRTALVGETAPDRVSEAASGPVSGRPSPTRLSSTTDVDDARAL